MIPSQLIQYIEARIAAGFPHDSTRAELLSNGWTEEDIAEAFAHITTPTAIVAPNKTYPIPERLISAKVPFAIVLAVLIAAYTTWQSLGGGQSVLSTSLPPTSTPVSQPVVAQNTATPTSTPPTSGQPAAQPTAPKPIGQYTDGSYTGSSADAYYGTVQVQAIIQGGRIADVKFLQYPNDRSNSRLINNQAMPLLIQEAIQVQSAQVDGVSGATFTTDAFKQSLASALVKAKN
ncbi:MAG: FMN-binding protein [Minisyncoccia bacterium]